MASLLPAMRRVVRTTLIYTVPAVVLAVMLPATAIAASGSGADSPKGYHAASGRIEQVGRRHGGKGYGGGYGGRSGYGNMSYGGRNSYGNNSGYGNNGYSRSGYGNNSGAYCNTYGNSGYKNSGYGNSGYMNSGYGNSGYGNSGYSNSGYGGSGYSSGYGSMGYGKGYTSSGNYATGTYKIVYPAPQVAQQVAEPGAVTLQMSSSAELGDFLVGPNGMTLYTLDHDTPNQSVCTGDCAAAWPPLTVAAGAAPVAAEGATGTMGVITRADGTWQVTYNQRPLYYYAQDQRVGDTTGNGVEGVWWVAAP